MILSLTFFILAAICNAVMDVSQFHYHQSVFNRPSLKEQWWNGGVSWRNKYINGDSRMGRKKILWGRANYPVQITDAFHFFKMLMIIFLAISVCLFNVADVFVNPKWYSQIIIIGIYGTVWNVMFSLFYNKVLRG